MTNISKPTYTLTLLINASYLKNRENICEIYLESAKKMWIISRECQKDVNEKGEYIQRLISVVTETYTTGIYKSLSLQNLFMRGIDA